MRCVRNSRPGSVRTPTSLRCARDDSYRSPTLAARMFDCAVALIASLVWESEAVVLDGPLRPPLTASSMFDLLYLDRLLSAPGLRSSSYHPESSPLLSSCALAPPPRPDARTDLWGRPQLPERNRFWLRSVSGRDARRRQGDCTAGQGWGRTGGDGGGAGHAQRARLSDAAGWGWGQEPSTRP